MRGLDDLDAGFVVVDLHRFFGIDVTPGLLRRKSWHWLTGRAHSLLDIPGSLTRREATRGV